MTRHTRVHEIKFFREYDFVSYQHAPNNNHVNATNEESPFHPGESHGERIQKS